MGGALLGGGLSECNPDVVRRMRAMEEVSGWVGGLVGWLVGWWVSERGGVGWGVLGGVRDKTHQHSPPHLSIDPPPQHNKPPITTK